MKNILLVLFSLVFSLNTSFVKGNSDVYAGAPRINTPHITGNYPSTPFLLYIATSGERPITWSVQELPEGLIFNPETGIISGSVEKEGDYKLTITASNKYGKTNKDLIISIGNELALTPPMGWNSWNTFGEHLTEALIIETADAMVKNGMRDVGYTYINIDDFWQLKERDADGHIQINKEKFPNGIKYVADYLHNLGFKLGIYSDAADKTCGGVCGSYGYEEIDAKDFSEWGVDLLKYDYCNAPDDKQEAIKRYTAMGNALKASGRSIIYSICEWGQRKPWTWAKQAGGHYWRTTFDIRDRWQSDIYSHEYNGVMNIVEINEPLDRYAGPGGWNDPDMLIVGINGNSKSMNYGEGIRFGCTPEQYRSHMSLWAMMASPLLSGSDARNMDEATITTLTNFGIIEINQDALGKQGKRILKTEIYDIWEKQLTEGRVAIAILNKSDKKSDIVLDKMSIPSLSNRKMIKDVWECKDIEKESNRKILLEPYQCKVFIYK